MDKIKLNTMGVFPKVEPVWIKIGDADVEVTPYIPYEKMLDMIQWVIDYVINDRPFLSAPLVRIMKDFAILKFYTNFDFSFLENFHEMSEIYQEYDFIQRFELLDQVKPLLDDKQMAFFEKTTKETLDSIIAYRNSAQGIMETLAANAKRDTSAMQEAIDMLGDDENGKKLAALMQFAAEIKGVDTNGSDTTTAPVGSA